MTRASINASHGNMGYPNVVDQCIHPTHKEWFSSLASSADPAATLYLYIASSTSNMLSDMSDLENSMVSIINVFHKYSGHKCHLKKADLKDLINNEMSHFMKKVQDSETLDQIFTDLDQNGDLEIDFQEFIALIAMVTSACHDLDRPEHR
ncbi:protein S100-B-like [Alosa alosa]|nr:protein S100-B-like [Alosa alosa]